VVERLPSKQGVVSSSLTHRSKSRGSSTVEQDVANVQTRVQLPPLAPTPQAEGRTPEGPKPKFDRNAYQRDLMRKRRAASKGVSLT
jgi:hypothetical protein